MLGSFPSPTKAGKARAAPHLRCTKTLRKKEGAVRVWHAIFGRVLETTVGFEYALQYTLV